MPLWLASVNNEKRRDPCPKQKRTLPPKTKRKRNPLLRKSLKQRLRVNLRPRLKLNQNLLQNLKNKNPLHCQKTPNLD
jgi:hypothetical protein